jgi:hypothetical protein
MKVTSTYISFSQCCTATSLQAPKLQLSFVPFMEPALTVAQRQAASRRTTRLLDDAIARCSAVRINKLIS